jgi:glycosyltransferase involved in cell wall biosynthesis
VLPRRVSEATFGLANHLLTQRAQRAVIRRLITPATVIHQPIPVSPRFPSLLYDLGAPVVIGPLNGGMEYPAAFRRAESGISRALIVAGRSLTNLTNALLPGKRRAAVVLVANARTRAALPSGLEGRILELPENAVEETQWTLPVDAAPSRRFVFIGRLVDWKALDIVLEAMRSVPEAELEVIGDGPMLTPWRTLEERLGLSARVHFRGWQSQAVCAEALLGARALVLPSIYECGGAVVLEAMASAVPVIATGWGGPADYLNSECGILIEPSSRADLIAGFADAMERLLQSDALREQLGGAGRERVLREFTWAHKIDRIQAIYDSTLSR